ncbi:NYN domain-containing protein [Candidatus Binatia bacterium]|nr:NYN domain-containing protein [Candidatus Binatia bacterium]
MDGFNLYHAIRDLRLPHLKWVDLWALLERFARPPAAELRTVYYFSAYATWLKEQHLRHAQYVAALGAHRVTPVLGNFKKKTYRCKQCEQTIEGHEEKETDVNLALGLYRGAVKDEYDLALVVSGDSDLAPAVRAVKRDFPVKRILIVTPVGRKASYDLLDAAGGPRMGREMRRSHIAAALLPRYVYANPSGELVATRPKEYDPPPG